MNSKTKLIHCGRGDQNVEVRSVNPTLMRASTILFCKGYFKKNM